MRRCTEHRGRWNVITPIAERVIARMRENAEQNRDLSYGADPDRTLAELGLPPRTQPVTEAPVLLAEFQRTSGPRRTRMVRGQC